MKKANIADLKNRLSYYIEQVKRGETVLVMDRKTPVARLVPVPPPALMSSDEQEAWLLRMEAEGILRVGTRKRVPELLKPPPPPAPAPARETDMVKTLIEDRGRR